jgi:hypothetical protein
MEDLHRFTSSSFNVIVAVTLWFLYDAKLVPPKLQSSIRDRQEKDERLRKRGRVMAG